MARKIKAIGSDWVMEVTKEFTPLFGGDVGESAWLSLLDRELYPKEAARGMATSVERTLTKPASRFGLDGFVILELKNGRCVKITTSEDLFFSDAAKDFQAYKEGRGPYEKENL